jgi:hypothetical protein
LINRAEHGIPISIDRLDLHAIAELQVRGERLAFDTVNRAPLGNASRADLCVAWRE